MQDLAPLDLKPVPVAAGKRALVLAGDGGQAGDAVLEAIGEAGGAELIAGRAEAWRARVEADAGVLLEIDLQQRQIRMRVGIAAACIGYPAQDPD